MLHLFEQPTTRKNGNLRTFRWLIYGLLPQGDIDLRLIAADAKDDPGSKLNVCVNKILEKYREYDSIKAAQVVFTIFPAQKRQIVCFEYSVDQAETGCSGIPADEIAIINDYKTDKQRRRCSTW